MLIDEVDTFIRENKEFKGIINAGHTRANAFVLRTVGDQHEPKRFTVWSPKALAGKGYEVSQFTDAFARYLPDSENLPQRCNDSPESNNGEAEDVADAKNVAATAITEETQGPMAKPLRFFFFLQQ